MMVHFYRKCSSWFLHCKISIYWVSNKDIENVNVNLDLTTVLNVELEQSAIEGEEVRVLAEKPLVKKMQLTQRSSQLK